MSSGSCTSSNDSTCSWTCTRCTRSSDITACPDKNVWGLSFDDGPGFYTTNLLKYLDDQGLKATFFVVGSRAVTFPQVLREEYMSGHQIAVHTWSHPMLTTLTDEQIVAELGWSKKIIKDLLGVTPTMMRPPYGDIECVELARPLVPCSFFSVFIISDRVRNISMAMGLTPVIWTSVGASGANTTFDTQGAKPLLTRLPHL
jgi:peptidoglycan/xylan/chitin deacetylase (PgdA/CDA1 family)